MLNVRFRTTLDNFLNDACFYYAYDPDSPEIDQLILYWKLLENPSFCTIMARALTIELEYRYRTSEDDCDDYTVLFSELEQELNSTRWKESSKYPVQADLLSDFSYILLEHITQWVIELEDNNYRVDSIVKRGEVMDVTVM